MSCDVIVKLWLHISTWKREAVYICDRFFFSFCLLRIFKFIHLNLLLPPINCLTRNSTQNLRAILFFFVETKFASHSNLEKVMEILFRGQTTICLRLCWFVSGCWYHLLPGCWMLLSLLEELAKRRLPRLVLPGIVQIQRMSVTGLPEHQAVI